MTNDDFENVLSQAVVEVDSMITRRLTPEEHQSIAECVSSLLFANSQIVHNGHEGRTEAVNALRDKAVGAIKAKMTSEAGSLSPADMDALCDALATFSHWYASEITDDDKAISKHH